MKERRPAPGGALSCLTAPRTSVFWQRCELGEPAPDPIPVSAESRWQADGLPVSGGSGGGGAVFAEVEVVFGRELEAL